MEICTSVMEGTSDQRYEFVSLLDREALALLDIFGHRMAMLSVRENSYDYLLKGLVALTFAAVKSDYREILMTISLFYQSAVKLKIDPKQLFTTASQYAMTESAQKLILGFLDRSPENKGIDKMGFKEVYGPSGLIYQFGSQPNPDGWL